MARLRVPFYRQTFDFTCGPASLMMAMRAFDPSIEATRDLEIDIWREANMVEAYASSRQGLALAAHRRGFAARTQGTARSLELVGCMGIPLEGEQGKAARALHEDLKRRCSMADIPDEIREVTSQDVAGWLGRGWVPLALVDARMVGDEELPHWVVAVGQDGGEVVINDPLAVKGGTRVPKDEFERWLGFKGTTCAVAVEGRREDRPRNAGFTKTLKPRRRLARTG